MKAYKYNALLWHLIAAMDSGKYDSLTFEEVYRHTEAGSIKALVVDRFGSDIPLSILEPQEWAELSDLWANLANAVDARRKFGVESRGICLLMAYTLEGLQQSLHAEKEAA